MKWAGVRLINEERKQKDESVRRGEHLAAKKKKKNSNSTFLAADEEEFIIRYGDKSIIWINKTERT